MISTFQRNRHFRKVSVNKTFTHVQEQKKAISPRHSAYTPSSVKSPLCTIISRWLSLIYYSVFHNLILFHSSLCILVYFSHCALLLHLFALVFYSLFFLSCVVCMCQNMKVIRFLFGIKHVLKFLAFLNIVMKYITFKERSHFAFLKFGTEYLTDKHFCLNN